MRSKLGVFSVALATAFVIPLSPASAASDFASPVDYAAGDGPIAVTTADFNGDTNPDVAVANFKGDTVSVLLGVGDGTLGPATTFSAGGTSPASAAAADFDGDGDLDLVTVNVNSGNASVFENDGAGAFAAPVLHATGLFPTSVATGDFNGDGDPDLAVANQSGTVTILLGGAGSSFSPAVGSPFAVGDGPKSIAIGDLDGDSDLDLAIAGASNVYVLKGDGTGAFGAPVETVVGGSLGSLAMGDLDGDSDLDLAVSISNSAIVTILHNDGVGGFPSPVFPTDYYDVGGGPVSVTLADLDGDGDLDIITPSQNDNNVSVLDGNGDGTFVTPDITFAVGAIPQHVAADDFNGDGKPDLATAIYDSDNVSVLLNDPNFTTGPTASISGTVRQGQTLTAHEGSPDPTPDSFSYKWFADGAEIAGQTTNTLLLTSAQVGKKISVEVTAHKATYNNASDTSPETIPVVGIFSPGPTASISGYARVGSTLTANAGSPSPTPTTLGYRWFADGQQLSTVTRTLKLTSALNGKRIQAKVFAIKSGYLTATSLSPATARVSSLQAKTISLELNDYSVRRGQRVYANLDELASGEPWSILLDGKKLVSGKADSTGFARTSFVVPTNAALGERTIRANGAFPDRTDPDRITVR